MGRLADKGRCPTTRKHRFEHKVDAVVAASTATRKGTSSTIRIYFCTGCSGWHMTKAPMARGGRQT